MAEQQFPFPRGWEKNDKCMIAYLMCYREMVNFMGLAEEPKEEEKMVEASTQTAMEFPEEELAQPQRKRVKPVEEEEKTYHMFLPKLMNVCGVKIDLPHKSRGQHSMYHELGKTLTLFGCAKTIKKNGRTQYAITDWKVAKNEIAMILQQADNKFKLVKRNPYH